MKSALYSLRNLTLTKTCHFLRNLKNLNKMTKDLEIFPPENNVLFKFNFLRLYKVVFKNLKAYKLNFFIVNSLMPSLFYDMPSKILQSHKEKSCLDNCISRMKFFENLTSEKTANLINILTGFWSKKCSKLKNACTKNKIWRDNRK